ncbi:MAG: FG-GAP repeat domain-containing protein [Thermoguttaceae bacterium]
MTNYGFRYSNCLCVFLAFVFTVIGYSFLYAENGGANVAEKPAENGPTYKKLVLSENFYAEGANCGDFNRDGHLDVVAGPFWFEGPDFTVRHEYTEVKEVDPEGYSEFFFAFTGDFNGDGWEDIFIVGFPGATGHWFENPKGKSGLWKKTLAIPSVGNESPQMVDLDGDGQQEMIYVKDGRFGYAKYNVNDPYALWTFYPISAEGANFPKAGHGIGFGDLNEDDRIDLICSEGWFSAPSQNDREESWKFHPYDFADAGAQIIVLDVDGDGKNDVVTSWHCHLYGLVWYKQLRTVSGEIGWEKFEILSPTPDETSDELRISQLHAFDVADFSGSGRPDFVTGKRWWAHGSKGDKEPNAPAVLYWFELKRDGWGGVEIRPHLIDDCSGVGTQVVAQDLNEDGVPDVIVANKRGIFVFLSEK